MSCPLGRPAHSRKFTPELADEICKEYANTDRSLEDICKSRPEWPSALVVNTWIIKDLEGFAAQWDRARKLRADFLFDQCVSIADDQSRDMDVEGKKTAVAVQRDRLRIDTRKFICARLNPNKYADKIELPIPCAVDQQPQNVLVYIHGLGKTGLGQRLIDRILHMHEQRAIDAVEAEAVEAGSDVG